MGIKQMTAACHICPHPNLEICSIGVDRARITSDCKPWPAKSDLAICSSCQTVQTAVTTAWREQVSKIYQEYQVYHQAGGVEQAVFDASGEAQSRSSRLVAKLAETSALPKSGHALDIGCGNGSFLSAYGKTYPAWNLSGAEFDDKHASELSTLKKFEKLYIVGLEKIERRFDFVSMIHTLEHIENPLPFLMAARALLKPSGTIFIQVPHHRENPFELMTYDHASHFDVSTLCRLLHRASLFPIHISTDWVSKEISILASTSESRPTNAVAAGWDFKDCLKWLEKLINRAMEIQAKASSFGIFGSSIAATWTAINLPRLPDFFVDEDPARVGKTLLEKPILHPESLADGSVVFVALQPAIQKRILEKYRHKINNAFMAD